MERSTNTIRIKNLFRNNFIGLNELEPFLKLLENSSENYKEPEIPYSFEYLEKFAKDYILILGLASVTNSKPITINTLRNIFGINPSQSEPCFYNQDWYLNEKFIHLELNNIWYLIKKEVIEDTRAIQPTDILMRKIKFPSAILCTYTFFSYKTYYNHILWSNDFVWCCDKDHNGDRIYVGKYYDIEGINKNGYSIHRHLTLRKCYASVNTIY